MERERGRDLEVVRGPGLPGLLGPLLGVGDGPDGPGRRPGPPAPRGGRPPRPAPHGSGSTTRSGSSPRSSSSTPWSTSAPARWRSPSPPTSSAAPRWAEATAVAISTTITTVVVLFLGEIIPKTVAKRHPVRVALATIPAVQAPLPGALADLGGHHRGHRGGGPALRRRATAAAAGGHQRGDRVPHRDGDPRGRPRRGQGGAPQLGARVRRPGGQGDHDPPHPHGGGGRRRLAGGAPQGRHREPLQPHAGLPGLGGRHRRHPHGARHRAGAPARPALQASSWRGTSSRPSSCRSR